MTDLYITINHLEDFASVLFLKTGDELVLKKDKNNIYDEEAIAVYNSENKKCGYVANSVYSVIKGTSSAGRIYDHLSEMKKCVVRFIFFEENVAIAQIS